MFENVFEKVPRIVFQKVLTFKQATFFLLKIKFRQLQINDAARNNEMKNIFITDRTKRGSSKPISKYAREKIAFRSNQ